MNPFIRAIVQGAAGGIVVAVFLFLTGLSPQHVFTQSGKQPIANVLQARAFQVVDDEGAIVASLSGTPTREGLLILKPAMKEGSVSVSPSEGLRFSAANKSNVEIQAEHIRIYNVGQGESTLGGGYLKIRSNAGGIVLMDHRTGVMRAALGSVELQTQTDEARQRPLSSLVLFDIKQKVIWSAP